MDILTVAQAAKLLEVDEKTVYRLIEREGLPAFRIGRQWRMRASDLDAWIDSRLRVREQPAVYAPEQQPLFNRLALPANGEGGFSDSAFSENGALPVHRWVPWIAGFSATFVREVLDRYLPNRADPSSLAVLDPFAGVGTTPFTAMLRGHAVYAFEINPYAAEACRLKLNVRRVRADALDNAIERFERDVSRSVRDGAEPASAHPAGFRTRGRFFSPEVGRKALLVKDFIRTLDDEWVRSCFRLALASEMVGFSNYSYEPSLGRRASAGKPDVADADVVGAVARKLSRIAEDVRWAQEQLGRLPRAGPTTFVAGDFFAHESLVPTGGVDLVITSPPYLNNYHYIRNSRPQVYWLDLAARPSDLRKVEEGSFGKFWQTVRAGPPVPLAFEMPELARSLDLLRGMNAERGQYGGPGWANYAATYFNDCHRLGKALGRVLRPGGRAVVVLGNSILQGVEFKTDRLFARICELAGLACEDVLPLREKRTGTSIIQSAVRAEAAEERTRLYESAVVLSKAG